MHQVQVYADYINLLDENINSIKNTETQLDASKEDDFNFSMGISNVPRRHKCEVEVKLHAV